MNAEHPGEDMPGGTVKSRRHYHALKAKHVLRDRSDRWTYRVRLAVASWVLGKENWRALYRFIIANAAANPEQVDDLLVVHFGSSGGPDAS